MWKKWFPWKFLVKRVALAHGFLDPITILGHLRRFGQQSEVSEPLELLRAGLVFHARGLINTRAIQHNLDWVWPFWVERQFNPRDPSFIPRAFSLTHVNLTHRNWTAVGTPGSDEYCIVDPCGLITPFWDGWSIDFWIIGREPKHDLLPSRSADVHQSFELGAPDPSIRTEAKLADARIISDVKGEIEGEDEFCTASVGAISGFPGWLAVVLRPYNPEGISFVHQIDYHDWQWTVDRKHEVFFSEKIDRHAASTYRYGDVYHHLRVPANARPFSSPAECEIGMATAAALFELRPGVERVIRLTVPLKKRRILPKKMDWKRPKRETWEEALAPASRAVIPDPAMQRLYDTAVRTLVLLSPDVVYPGPYTYKRFWFRDAAFMVQALLCSGLGERALRCLDTFPERQTSLGYFLSQEGEWDSNGEALWALSQYCLLTGAPPPAGWQTSIEKGAKWIMSKRIRGSPPASQRSPAARIQRGAPRGQ